MPLLAHTRLRRIQFLVTQKWGLIQGGWLPEAEALWAECIELLELDADAVQDLMLLVAQGIAGRSEANEILWDLLTRWGVEGMRDISHKASNLVTIARRSLDAPPPNHPDMQKWTWRNAWYPRNLAFSPGSVPRDRRSKGDPQGRPLRPPACWVPPGPPPAGPPSQQGSAASYGGASSSSGAPAASRPFPRRSGR